MSLWEAISSPANFPNYDSRNDLGLGKTQSHLFFHRQYRGSYPYKSFEEEIDDEYDPDVEEGDNIETDHVTAAKFMNKLGKKNSHDPLAARSVDNQYYTPSASVRFDMAKLGEAVGTRSSRTSISPIPDLYKDKQAVIGGSNSWNAVKKDIQHTRGSKKGFSSAPFPLLDKNNHWEDEKSDDDDPVSKIRRIVNAYHDLNLLER